MSSNLKIWTGLLVIVAGVAYWVSQKPAQNISEQQALIEAWQQEGTAVNDIDQVVLSQADKQVVLSKTGDAWQLNDGFYAAPDHLIKLIRSLQAAQIIEAKTANPEKHAQLELADSDVLVSLFSDKQLQQAFYIGKQSSSGLTFVRRKDEDQTYAVSGLSKVSVNADNWRLKTVLDVAAEDVQSVSFLPADGEAVSAMRNPEDGDIQLTSMPDGFQLKSDAYLEQLFNGLTRLTIDEAITADSWPVEVDDVEDVTEIPIQLTAKYKLNTGESIQLTIYHQNEAYFMTIESKSYPQYNDWVMKIAEYKFKALNRQLSEFIEPVTAEQIEEAIQPESVQPASENNDG